MKRRLTQEPENTEINVSPLIDLVFILLIFFIVATSFVNEVGITPKHKDTASSSSNLEEPLAFDLCPVPVSCCRTVCQLGSNKLPRWYAADLLRKTIYSGTGVPGARAGLATQVMDQAMLGGAQAVKLTPLAQ